MTKKPEDLRSARWFEPDDLRSMGHRSRAMQMVLPARTGQANPSSQLLTLGLIYRPATTICATELNG